VDRYIEVNKVIELAQQKGVDFGKANPYNRLRYYTKIGLLPHMERRRNAQGSIVGHYPEWAAERLALIEKLKSEGYENDEISRKIQELNAKHSTLTALKNPNFRSQILKYGIIMLLIIIVLTELRIIPVGIEKNPINTATTEAQILNQSADSGSYFVAENENTAFVKYPKAQPLSKIVITFTQDFSPANKYWIKEIKSGEGFTVELDTKVFNDKWFNWYATD
jgi:DNA-binding transcriptional MerR regulator